MILVLGVAILPLSVYAQTGDNTLNSLFWLQDQQSENGSFADRIGTTSFALFAFASGGQQNATALTWLEEQDFSAVGLGDVSLALITLVANDIDVAEFADGNALARYSELMRDDLDTQRTDALCYGLVTRYNLDIPIQDDTLAMVQSRQNADGGFGANTAMPSDVVTTSVCVHALVAAGADNTVQDALGFLQATQLEDDGWQLENPENTLIASDPIATGFVMLALIAADEPLSDWGNPERTLILFADEDTGVFVFEESDDPLSDVIATTVAVPVFQGLSLNSFAPAEQVPATADASGGSDVPVLDANWKLVGDGFGVELDTADDFFVTVTDPFTSDELSGVEIINWTAEYSYTGYIVESHLTAEILLWMAGQDASVLDNLSPAALAMMPADELAQLPEAVQVRAADASE